MPHLHPISVICTYILHILVNLCLKYVSKSLIYILYSEAMLNIQRFCGKRLHVWNIVCTFASQFRNKGKNTNST